MIQALLSRFFPAPPGASAEVVLGCEGLSWGWAFFLFLVLSAVVWWLYLRGAPALSRGQRSLLTALRVALVAVFLLLLVKPVVLLTTNESVRERLLVV